MPILYFGNSSAYFHSKSLRIITVGHNPSKSEFSKTDGERFPRPLRRTDPRSYIAALDEYFESKPFVKWFGHYEKVLRGLQATYGGEMVSNNRIDKLSNFAIHTDLCSPLATDPAWGVLRLKHPQAHEDLRQGGVSLWRSLITDWLKPNIILVSTREEYLSDVIKKPVSEWDKLMPPIKQNADGSSRKKGPYSVKYCVVSFDHEKDHEKAVVVYAPFDQVPFNVYCKREIGKQIKEKYEGLF